MRITASPRSINPVEGLITLHPQEEIRFVLDCSKITSTISNLSVKLLHSEDNYQTDISGDHFSATTATRVDNTDFSMTNPLINLVNGVTYKLEFKFSDASGDVRVSVARIHCTND